MCLEDKIEILKGDITESNAEAIVNAANTELVLGSGVAGAIRKKGGPSIQAECSELGPIELGGAAVTGAGNLSAEYVIHAAGMRPGGRVSAESLKNAAQNSLQKARENGIKSLAFPAIGTGVGGFVVEECAQIMLSVCASFLKAGPGSVEKIYFVLFDEHTCKIFQNTLQSKLEK